MTGQLSDTTGDEVRFPDGGKLVDEQLEPEVTAVIPTRDRPQLLHRALASALAQTGVRLQIIIVDDGGVIPVADQLADVLRNDERVRVLRNERSRGVASARNRGLAEADAPWVAFLDDDDLWAPNKLSEQVRVLTATGASWCTTNALVVDESLVPIRIQTCNETAATIGRALCHHNAVPGGGSGTVASVEVLRHLGGFDENLSMLADWEMWHRLAHCADGAVLRQPLVAYTVHPASMTQHFDDHRAEMERFAAAAHSYCSSDAEARRVAYLDWVAEFGARETWAQRARAARLIGSLAWETRSAARTVKTLRILAIPGSFELRRAFRRRTQSPDTPTWLRFPQIASAER